MKETPSYWLAWRFHSALLSTWLQQSCRDVVLLMEKMNGTDLVNAFIKSRKNSNCIIELEKLLLSQDESVVLSSMGSVKDLFLHVLEKKEMYMATETDQIEKNSYEKYQTWLRDQYNDFKSHLLTYMVHKNKRIQELALDVLITFVKSEGRNPLKKVPEDKWYFPKELFLDVVQALSSEIVDMGHLIIHFKEYIKYNEIKLYTLKSIWSILINETNEVTDIFLRNVYSLLSVIQFPKEFPEDPAESSFIGENGERPPFVLKEKVFSKIFSLVWVRFLKYKLPSSLYKKVLILLHKKLLPYLTNPLLLTDFLTDSYNLGGAVSLLALNGLYFLIQNYNLEYPDFYKKLYALFDSSILNSKFKARFFYLSDLFLSSTHLPAYLVAAFAKRLGRLALSAPPHVLFMILPFIGNLLIRHPSLKVLIHRPDETDVLIDPYIFDEPDPVKCKALDSSLWEIKTLQHHWHPDVSTKAKFIDQELPLMEWDLANVLELNINDLIKKETKEFTEAPMSFEKPLGIFQSKEDKMNTLWTL